MASNKLQHENFHEDGNYIPDTRKTPAFSSENLNSSVLHNPLISNGNISQEACDVASYASINYISQILLEEDIDEESSIYPEEAALRDTEKSFYDILGQEYPSSLTLPQFHTPQNHNSRDNGSINTTENGSRNHMPSYSNYKPHLMSVDPISALSIESLPASQIQKGAEEAMKFLPAVEKLFIGLEPNKIEFHEEPKGNYVSEKMALCCNSGTKKCSRNDREPDLSEALARKQQASFSDEPERNENLYQFFLSRGQEYVKEVISVRETMQQEMKKESREHQVDLRSVDLKSLLVRCSEAVSANEYNNARELIKQIRKHSSPKGDCYQRLAYYLVNGLEARLVGTGSDIYHELLSKQGSVTDFLRAFRIYHAACPVLRASYYFAHRTILNVSKNAKKVHIIDFGIHMGFPWPCFFERLSSSGRALPKIRITGIEFPDKGFRPGKMVEETGRRLSEYAQRFNIRFKYQGIASKWENIRIEDLKIEKDEVLVVNCMFRLKNVADETTTMSCPRDKVLSMIREIKPCVFIHGIVNGSYSTPFFTSRFKEVFFSYSSLFDMFESTMPRDSEMRILIERNLVGPKAINSIACEGSERVERPETYKQWSARNLRAGFVQQPVDSMIMKKVATYVRELYHKDFVMAEDNKWLLLGWKGVILFAMSTWKPNEYESVD